MIDRKDLIIVVLVSFMLAVTLYPMTTASVSEYDPWADMNDDGTIDIRDITHLAMKFGTSGTPINKTDLLLELEARVSALEKLRVVAAGFILTDGTISKGYNIKSVTWNTGVSRYEIHMAGVNYYFSDYITIVTSVGIAVRVATTASVNGNLIVYIYDSAGNKVQGNFQFVTYETTD